MKLGSKRCLIVLIEGKVGRFQNPSKQNKAEIASDIVSRFVIRLCEKGDPPTEKIIRNLSRHYHVKKPKLLRQLVFSLGSRSHLHEHINRFEEIASQESEGIVSKVFDDFFQLAVKYGGVYHLKCTASHGWHCLLKYLRSIEYNDLGDLVQLLQAKILCPDGEWLNPYSLNDSFSLVSSYFEADYSTVGKAWVEDSMKAIRENGPGNPKLPFVTAVLIEHGKIRRAEHGGITYSSVLKRYLYMDPPWKHLNIPFGSIGWRMGGGEDYMGEWHEFIKQLSEEELRLYQQQIVPPKEWKNWYDNCMANVSRNVSRTVDNDLEEVEVADD